MTRIIGTVLLGAGLLAGVTTMPSSEAHEGHEGHDHGPAEVAPERVAPSEKSPDIVNTPPPFETLENAPADSSALPEQNYGRERAPSPRDWGQRNDRRLQSIEPPITPRREFDDLPRLQTAPRAFDMYPRNRQTGPRRYKDVPPPASPLQGCEIGCPLDAANVNRYGNRLLPSDTWRCPQPSGCALSIGPQVYRNSDELDCHAYESFGDGGFSCRYGEPY